MFKRIVPFALLAAWIPQAHAFPPCPVQPMEYGPPPEDASVTAKSASDAAPWFKAQYAFVGDPNVIGQIAPERGIDTTVVPNTGKCRDRDALPVPNPHASTGILHLNPAYPHTSAGILHLNPAYAPASGFGIIDLPSLPEVATDGLRIEYQWNFTVDNELLRSPADWLDVAQLDFFRNGSAGRKYTDAVSSVYRVRKTQRNRTYATIEIIESRAAPAGIMIRPPLIDRVVAVIPLRHGQNTAIKLRWTQAAKRRVREVGESPLDAEYDIDVVLEVLNASNQVLYTAQLPGQWASLLSMGLLDYNVGDASVYEKMGVMEFSNMTLSATER